MGLRKENEESAFDFDAEFAKGLTLEEAKVESIRRIREWWGDEKSKIQKPKTDLETFDFDTEFERGLTPEEFKSEMAKRIKAYPWK
ncbi:hypothetical protein GON26_13155 [Flavobacterium sp. GA093]|jgi:hypothetical protein|uniref:Uncharacterized protein n=1 Tax=Flavobacterium hydrocarbonoxydans TaxID=2683249 RepID=A0A6I4NLT4_9FLAO|nr:hypothetical protein [Flavobacterium hydrocarbonoxydans]MWB95310.1 hypothetical protein [Flavobacterium hydrocarbonoxydans]